MSAISSPPRGSISSSASPSSPASSRSPPVSSSVTESRLPATPLAIFLFILYFPLGCGLAIVRFLLAFQIFLFTTFWPLPFGGLRNYLLRVMSSYLLGVWVKDQRPTRPLPLPHAGRAGFRHRRRHHLNKTLDDNDESEDGQSPTNDEIRQSRTEMPPFTSSSSSSSSSSFPKLLVANSVTPLDGAVICLIHEKIRVLNTLKLSPLLAWLFGYRSLRLGRSGRRGGGGGGRNEGGGLNSSPTPLELTMDEEVEAGRKGLLVFPELTSTNGNAVVKFEEKTVCCRQAKTTTTTMKDAVGERAECDAELVPLLPIAVRFRRYPIDFPYSTIESSHFSDFFWLLWCPINVFTIEMLDEIVLHPNETPKELALRAQVAIASSLKVPPLTHGHLDRQEYIKRRLKDIFRDDSASAGATSASSAAGRRRRQRLNDSVGGAAPRDAQMASRDAALEIMVEQVKTVLPQVPTAVIRKEVRLTKDVDVSITRFLEGVVAYVAEDNSTAVTTDSKSSDADSLSNEIGAASKSNVTSVKAASPSKPLAASQFAKSSELRQMSFAERKRLLIEQSKERYLKRTAIKLKTPETGS